MAIEDHPIYEKWREALERWIEADERYREAKRSNDPAVGAAKLDLETACSSFFEIADRID